MTDPATSTAPRARNTFNALALVASFAVLAGVLTWPLALNLNSQLLGDPTGDTGVYIWNIWIFRHELLRHGHLPFSTEHIFGFTGGADFALHNYTALAGLVGAPLIAPLGLVGTFNVLMIGAIASSGLAMYVLTRRLGVSAPAAWAAGALFMAAPVLTARQTAHFSLVIAAPLPLFVWAVFRTLDRLRVTDAILTGVICAMATYCDAYYGVYCALMGIVIGTCYFVRIERRESLSGSTTAKIIKALIALVALMVAWRLWTGITQIDIAGIHLGLQTLYTPMLVLVALLAAWGWTRLRPSVSLDDPDRRLRRLVVLGGVALAVCVSLLLPVLIGIAVRMWMHRLPATETYWRSSPRGVDLLAYFVPNPNHPLFGHFTRGWFLPDKPDAFPEFIGSCSIVAIALIGRAIWKRSLPSGWVAFTLFFAAISLGPFVYVGGTNTFVPGPWAFLRYVPVIGMARSPSRFAIVTALGVSVLFAFTIEKWRLARAEGRVRRTAEISIVAMALVFELVPVPRPLYSAQVPDVYRLIATSPDNEFGRLLELPTGVRDGTSSLGDFNASTQYFQTVHRRQLVGGYLSRVSMWRRNQNLRDPVLRALFALGEKREIPGGWRNEAAEDRDEFLARSCVRYVIVDKRRATPELRDLATDVLGLTSVHEDQQYELLVPADPPPCRAPGMTP